MVDSFLIFLSEYLVIIMSGMLVSGLLFRWFSYRHSKFDGGYFTILTRELETTIEKDREDKVEVKDPDHYLSDLLGRVSKKLPDRSLRSREGIKRESREQDEGRELISLGDFVSSKEGLMASIQSESSVFISKSQPNFNELTRRILEQDKKWTSLFGVIPIDGVSRMIDILPTLFIVFGVLGTFIGISLALPAIAQFDFNDLDKSQEILNTFVGKISFAMTTSVMGIFFNLVLTFLNTLFPIKDVRNRIFKKVENSFQVLWYHLQDDKSNRTPAQLMAGMLKSLEQISAQLDEHSPKKKKAS